MIKKLINSFIYDGHLICLGAIGIVLTLVILTEQPICFYPLVVIYFLTFSYLLFDRYKEKNTDYITNPERTKSLEKYFKKISLIIFSAIIITIIILAINNAKNSLLFLLLLMMIMFFYTKHLKRLTKKIPIFKNLIFSLTTSLLLVFISIYYSYNFLSLVFLVFFSFCFLRMIINTIFLDIKDLESDRRNELKTLPIVFGYKKTILILKIISLLSGLLLIFAVLFDLLPVYSLFLIFVVPYSFYYFKKSEKKENFYLANYILADMEFILWPISIIIGKTIL